jgi:hypothetical protein
MPGGMARGPLKNTRRGLRVFGYRLAHAILPGPLRRGVRSAFGGPSQYDEKRAAEKIAHVREKQEKAKARETERAAAAAARELSQRQKAESKLAKESGTLTAEKEAAKRNKKSQKEAHRREALLAKAEREGAKADWAEAKSEVEPELPGQEPARPDEAQAG